MDIITVEKLILFMLITWTSFIGQFVHPVGGEGRGLGKEDHYFSHLQVSQH